MASSPSKFPRPDDPDALKDACCASGTDQGVIGRDSAVETSAPWSMIESNGPESILSNVSRDDDFHSLFQEVDQLWHLSNRP